MRARGVAVILVLMTCLLLGVQVLATDTGAVYGEHWSDPVTVAEQRVAAEGGVADLASASADPGALAWLSQDEDTWRVRVARVDSAGPGVEETATVAETTADLEDVAVAARGPTLGVAWKNVTAGEVHLAVRKLGRWERHTFGGALVLDEPSVALLEDVPIVVWQDRRNGTRAVQLAAVTGDGVVHRRFGQGVTGDGSPSVVTVGSGVAVVIANGTESRAQVRFADLAGGDVALSPWRDLGPARPRSTSRSGGGTVIVDAAANGSAARVLWTDIQTATVRVVRPGGRLGPAEPVTQGRAPAIAAAGDERLVGWLTTGRTTSLDVVASYSGPSGTVTETVSRLSSTATFVDPVFAPGPTLAWSERGSDRSRVLFARFEPDGSRSFFDRLTNSPLQFVALTVAGLVVGLVTLPMMPWSVVALLGAFLFTTRAAMRALSTVTDWLGLAVGRPARSSGLRKRLAALPPAVWVVQFGAAQTAIGVLVVISSGRAQAVGFTAPVLTGIAAVVVTLTVVRLAPLRSNWWSVATAAYAYNAAMWMTALPTFL